MSDSNFEGWLAVDKESGVGGMKWQQYEPKQFEETDVDIKISHCGNSTHLHCPRAPHLVADSICNISGVCGSDVHALRSALFPTDYPCCAGHE